MATLVSPGVSVTVTDESMYIPVSGPTVPLVFIATADEKKQPDGITPAEGTYEHGIVRTVTSVKQTIQLYGVPTFLTEAGTGLPLHGDARNEYGLQAVIDFLGIGNRAYVVRANVNLNDEFSDLQALWMRKIEEAKVILENLINEYIYEFNNTNGLIPNDPNYKVTVTPSELLSLINQATEFVFSVYSFKNIRDDYINDHSANPLNMFANGFGNPATGTYQGITYIAQNINSLPSYPGGDTVPGNFTAQEGGDLLVAAADELKITREFLNKTSLGANDAARRVAIATAFQEAINSNTEIRADTFDYNLIVCPGYHEAVDEMLALVTDIRDEALVIADCPVNESPESLTNPATGWAQTSARQRSVNVAYYYPWAKKSSLEGKDIVVPPSSVALRTYAYSDNVSYLWFAPAGTRRGIITGISQLGYVSGTLGTPTKFIETNLNEGQQSALYQFAPSGDINPLLFVPGRGFMVFGQKTSAPQASAMDRVNVSRLIKYIKRQLRRNTLSFVFEPNDQITRDSLKSVVDSFLGDLITKRALEDFATVCDESNNTPDRIDRNELFIDIAIAPIKAAEFLYIPIRIVNTGAVQSS